MAYVRPRHLVPMTDFNNIPELALTGAAGNQDQTSPEIPALPSGPPFPDPLNRLGQVNIASLTVNYGASQQTYQHLRFAIFQGKTNISVTTQAGGAILTGFDWSLVQPPTGGNFDPTKINWTTASAERAFGIGADGSSVLLIGQPISATEIRYSFTPPAAAPAQTYTFASIFLQSGVNY